VKRRAVAIAAVAGGIVLGFGLGAAPAGAVELEGGCTGSGVSVDGDDQQLDEATAPSNDVGTEDRPFEVDYDGTVEWEGDTPVPFNDHSWHIDVMGVEVKSDGDPNGDDETTSDGTEVVEDYLPFKVTGLYYVTGEITSGDGSCSGNMYVELVGSPTGTIPWLAGIVFTGLGVALVVLSYPTGVEVVEAPSSEGPGVFTPEPPPPGEGS
jgi:hypothetical protein